jgi:hypothetical protein
LRLAQAINAPSAHLIRTDDPIEHRLPGNGVQAISLRSTVSHDQLAAAPMVTPRSAQA